MKHRFTERIRATGPSQTARVYALQVDAGLLVGAFGVTATFRICSGWRGQRKKISVYKNRERKYLTIHACIDSQRMREMKEAISTVCKRNIYKQQQRTSYYIQAM